MGTSVFWLTASSQKRRWQPGLESGVWNGSSPVRADNQLQVDGVRTELNCRTPLVWTRGLLGRGKNTTNLFRRILSVQREKQWVVFSYKLTPKPVNECMQQFYSEPKTGNHLKQTMVYPYHVILVSNKKEQTIDTLNNLNESSDN